MKKSYEFRGSISNDNFILALIEDGLDADAWGKDEDVEQFRNSDDPEIKKFLVVYDKYQEGQAFLRKSLRGEIWKI